MRLVPIHQPLRAKYGWYIDDVDFAELEGGFEQLKLLCHAMDWRFVRPLTVQHQGRFYANDPDFIVMVRLVYSELTE